MSSILTNTSAMVALQTLKGINSGLAKTQAEISTGKTVGSAKDNAAVWAISKVMESDVKGFSGISDSLALGESTVAVARKASETITDLLTQMKGKIVAAQEDNVDRGKIQTDVQALKDQIASVVGAAQFNGLNLVNGSGNASILSSLDRDSSGGVDEARGDVITLRSMPFEQAAAQGEIAHAGMFAASDINLMQLIQTVILGAVALVLGLFVLRPLLMRPPARDLPRLGRGEDLDGAALREGAIDMEDVAQPPVTLTDKLHRTDRQLPVAFDAAAAASGQNHDPVLRLKRLIEERQSESVEILRSWMEDEGETA